MLFRKYYVFLLPFFRLEDYIYNQIRNAVGG